MHASFKLISIKGITVYLHVTFLFVIFWMAVLFIASGMQRMQLLWYVLFLIAVFACIVLHEYGHALAASWYGINAKKITLYPIGGIASLERLPNNPKQELAISAAGPVVNFLIAVSLFLLSPQTFSFDSYQVYTGTIEASNFVYSLAVVNMALAVFNLIPAFPMDGGRIFRALLGFKYNYIKATVIAAAVGRVIAFLLIITGIVLLNLWLSLVGLFIIFFARAEESYMRFKSLVQDIQLKDVLMYRFDSLDAGLTVNEAVNMLEQKQTKYFMVTDQGIPVGTINRMEVMKALSEKAYGRKVGDLMNETILHFSADTPVEKMLDQLAQNEAKMYPVYDNGEFIGVVNFQHVIEYLLLQKVATDDYNRARSLAELV